MNKIILIIVALVALAAAAVFLFGGSLPGKPSAADFAEDPIDAAMDVANQWLQNLRATTSLSLADFVAGQARLTDDARAQVLAQADGDLDPILCQAITPERVGAKLVYVQDDGAQVMVLARGETKGPTLAMVTLTPGTDQWNISDISCSSGDAAPEVGEYTFEQIGRLVKDSVPAPYDNTAWHVIYPNDNGAVGVVPLLLSNTSVCLNGADSAPCDIGQFTEGAVVFVQASMTETGAQVGRLTVQ